MQPFLSVVIPAYNEAKFLPACLKTLKKQVTDFRYEIIVVDNNSDDETTLVAAAFGVQVISEKRAGVCFAREAGRSAAQGQVIVSTDADCQYPEDWIQQIGQAFRDQPDVSLLVGNYRFHNAPFWANHCLAMYEWLCLQLRFNFGFLLYASAANLAFRADAFHGYNTNFTQGGDELFVLQKLRLRGRVLMRFTNPVLTSSRRLQQGFIKTFFTDFLQHYLLNYWRTARTGVNRAGSYQAHRQAGAHHANSRAVWAVGAGISVAAVVLTLGVHGLLDHLAHPALFAGGYVALTAGILAYALLSPHSQLLGPQPYRVATKKKLVALTFDDGPNGQFSIELAEIIERYDGKASFFSVGKNVLREPEITKELYDRGHLIANHSYGHRAIDYVLPGWRKNLQATNKAITNVTGERPRFVRLPWLFRTPWLLSTCYRLGLQPVAGSFVSWREFQQPDGYKMARGFVKKVQPGDIIIMHDGYNAVGGDRHQTVSALAELCRQLHADGYQFVRLDALL